MYLNGHIAVMVRAISGSKVWFIGFLFIDDTNLLTAECLLWDQQSYKSTQCCTTCSRWCSYMARCSWCFQWCSRTIHMFMGTGGLDLHKSQMVICLQQMLSHWIVYLWLVWQPCCNSAPTTKWSHQSCWHLPVCWWQHGHPDPTFYW
jgi:hypothetical protein